MATSQVVLYKNCRLTPNKLFIVDDINEYLSKLSFYLVGTDFQYVRQGLRPIIKVNLSQDILDGSLTNNYNYCTIKNGTGKTYYYFIVNAIQLAKSTIQFELELDSINTFKPSTDFTIEDKTLIKRQHKDRFIRTENFLAESGDASSKSGIFSFDVLSVLHMVTLDSVKALFKVNQYGEILETYRFNKIEIILNLLSILEIKFYRDSTLLISIPWTSLDYTYLMSLDQDTYDLLNGSSISFLKEYKYLYYRKIDLTSEGVTPILYGINKTQIIDDNQNWYLVYKGNPLRSYVCADNPFEVEIGASSTISASDLVDGTYYYILAELNDKKDVQITSNTNNILTAYYYKPITSASTETCILRYYKSGGDIKMECMYYQQVFFFPYSFSNVGKTWTFSSFTITKSSGNVVVKSLPTKTHEISDIKQGSTSSILITATTYNNQPFMDIDLSANDIVKIIKLPYKPYNDSGIFKYDNTEKMIYLDDLSMGFNKDLIIEGYNPLKPLLVALPQSGEVVAKIKDNESKLYHSDYYQPKFIYDSYSFVFGLERVNLEKTGLTNSSDFNFEFSVTNTINSKMLFTFRSYIDDGLALEDYSNILYVARNNEVTLLDSGYINYLRNGYNYDVKTKERQEIGQWIGTGLSMVGAIVSFASSGVTGGFGVAAGISLGTTAMASLVSAVNTTAQAEATQNQKLNQYKNQRANVFGADDLDLMCRYSNNKAKLMIYSCSERMKNILYDLFYYTGYISGERGVPDMSSRKFFNFVACDLEINANSTHNITNEIMNDIKMKYSLGVTFLHKNTIIVDGVSTPLWDFNQEYENWENSIL